MHSKRWGLVRWVRPLVGNFKRAFTFKLDKEEYGESGSNGLTIIKKRVAFIYSSEQTYILTVFDELKTTDDTLNIYTFCFYVTISYQPVILIFLMIFSIYNYNGQRRL